MIVVDYFNCQRGLWDIEHGYILLFYTHIAYIVSTSFLLFLYYIHKKNIYFHKISAIIFSFFILNIGAFISGWVDQQIHCQITVYIATCFIVAFSFCFKYKHTVILYLQSYICLVLYLFIIQKDANILQGHLINSSISVVISGYISFSISKIMKRDYIHKHKLEELVKKRSDALILQQQTINRLQNFNELGELSAGIAHEIRNPLTTVRGFLQLLGSKDNYKNDKEFFVLMISELDRANSIITEFLSLTKDKRTDFKKTDLNSIIQKLVPLLDTNPKYDIKTELGQIPVISLDEKEISQIILNLANNGCDAMVSGGSLTIKTYKSKENVILEIQDEGAGIPPEIMEKIGTPFFTTKDKGTGLGIATCKTIIKKHNAKLEVKSSKQGSTFRVVFNA